MVIEAPGFRKLVTALYPEGDEYLSSDSVFGVKKSLIVVSVWFRRSSGPFYFISINFCKLTPLLVETHRSR
jgi:hypothetical protein